jgi:hypothetical protein
MDYGGPPVRAEVDIKHGCIRWDAWYGNDPDNYSSFYTARTFDDTDPVNYRDNAPSHLDQTTSPVTWADTQATFDAEINAAADGGIDYFAYLRYVTPDTRNLNAGYDYHIASSVGDRVGVTIIRQADDLGTTGNFAAQVADTVTIMQGARYYRLGGRPLLFIYIDANMLGDYWGGSFANLATAVASIRSSAIAAALPEPIIVSMGAGASRTNPGAMGCDACSNYIGAVPDGLPSTYETFMNYGAADWDTYSSTMVPITMVGWDKRARVQNPEPWAEGDTLTKYATAPTYAQFAAHLMQARAYIRANPTRCPYKTVLSYAWNECTEGGQMPCPTVGDPAGTLSRAFAMSKRALF